MDIHLIAVGEGMPQWVAVGLQEYTKRLRGAVSLQLVEVPAGHRSKNASIANLRREEGQRLLRAVPYGALIVALDERGTAWSTPDLAGRIDEWLMDGRVVALLVGGPDGLDDDVRKSAALTWSLSALTLPHQLVRVIVAEQVYRAWSLLEGYPYHR